MNIRKLVAFCIVAVLTVAAGCIALFGVSWGIYEVRPFAKQIVLGADLGGGMTLEYQATASSLAEQTDKVASIMRHRLDNIGYGDAQLTRAGSDLVRVDVPFNDSSKTNDSLVTAQYLAQTGLLEVAGSEGTKIFTGADMRQAYVQTLTSGSNAGAHVVTFALNGVGTAALASYSSLNPNGQLIVTLDGTTIEKAGLGGTAITNGIGYISNSGFTVDSANRLAQTIKSGAYPTAMTITDALQFAPILGGNAYTICAVALGVLLLAAFVALAVRYRLPGLMADFSLLIMALVLLFTLAAIPDIRLTLPGMLGLLIGIGFAIETDVMMLERMRREIVDGKTVHLAIKNGFPRAYTASFSAQLAVLFGAFLLMFIGNSTVSSLAVTLSIGIVLSMLQGLMTRWLTNLVQFYPIMRKSLFVPARLIPAAKAN